MNSVIYLAARNEKPFMIKYITTRPLWFNILVAIGILVILTLIFVLSLNWITRHGEATEGDDLEDGE